jgi:hypothetical protein
MPACRTEYGEDEMKSLKPFLLFLIGVLVLFSIGYYINKGVCDAKTSEIGFAHRFSMLGNCQIETSPGHWVPLENYYFQQQ